MKALTAAAEARASGDTDGEVAAVTGAHQQEIEAIRDAAAEERAAWAGLNQRLVRLRRSNKLMRSNTLALRQAAAPNPYYRDAKRSRKWWGRGK